MKFFVQLSLMTALLMLILIAMLHPDLGVMLQNPLATLGVLLIGAGLIRNAQQTRPAPAPAPDSDLPASPAD